MYVMKSKYIPALLLFPFLFLAVTAFLQAQTTVPVAGADPSTETTADTIARAVEDLEAASADRRKGAVMLLSKYPGNVIARRGLLRALDDEAATVRRAAAVSLVENRNALTPRVARRLVLTLEDPDGEVRQAIASALDLLFMQMLRGGTNNADTLKPIQSAIRSALGDEQPVVRRRVLESLRFFPGPKPAGTVRAALDDPVVAVRLAAYEAAAAILPPTDFVEAAATRHPDPSPSCRLLLADALARRPHPASAPLLEKLRRDEEPRVASAAAFALFLVRPRPSFPEAVLERIKTGQLETGGEQRLMRTLRSLPPETGRPLARTLLEEASGNLRRMAGSFLLRSHGEEVPESLLLRFLTDESPALRRSALRFARSRGHRLSAEFFDAMAGNPYSAVRRNALAIAASAPSALRRQLALSLLIDEEPSIRAAALETLASLRPDNFRRLFMASLRDPDPTVRRKAVQLLLGPLAPEGRQIARDFLEQFPETPVANLLRKQLAAS